MQTEFVPREALMSRANSLKKAIRQLVEHTEQAVDEQNKTTEVRSGPSFLITPPPPDQPQTPRTTKTLDIPGLPRPTDTLKASIALETQGHKQKNKGKERENSYQKLKGSP